MKIDPLVVIGLGGAAAWLAYNWWQSSQTSKALANSTQCAPVQIQTMNQAGAFLASVNPTSPQLASLRAQITACGGTPTF